MWHGSVLLPPEMSGWALQAGSMMEGVRFAKVPKQDFDVM